MAGAAATATATIGARWIGCRSPSPFAIPHAPPTNARSPPTSSTSVATSVFCRPIRTDDTGSFAAPAITPPMHHHHREPVRSHHGGGHVHHHKHTDHPHGFHHLRHKRGHQV